MESRKSQNLYSPREKINWWWFLFFGGILIPGLFFGILKADPFYIYLNQDFIASLSPFFVHAVNFLLLLLICLLFKLVARLSSDSSRLSYGVAGTAITIFIIIETFLEDNVWMPSNISRQNSALTADAHNNTSWWLAVLPGILIIGLFYLFFIKNFPKKFHSA